MGRGSTSLGNIPKKNIFLRSSLTLVLLLWSNAVFCSETAGGGISACWSQLELPSGRMSRFNKRWDGNTGGVRTEGNTKAKRWKYRWGEEREMPEKRDGKWKYRKCTRWDGYSRDVKDIQEIIWKYRKWYENRVLRREMYLQETEEEKWKCKQQIGNIVVALKMPHMGSRFS